MLASRLMRTPRPQWGLSHRSRPIPSTVCPRNRLFHASAPRNSALDAMLYLPHEMLQYLHVGLPWYTAIPVSAFIVRGLLVTTMGTYARSLTSRYVALNPLRQAIGLQVRDRMMKKGGFQNPRQAKLAISKEIKKETSALDKRWNCTLWGQVGWTLAQLPLFLVMAEIIRRMSAMKDGLLRMAMNAVGLGGDSAAGDSVLSSTYTSDLATNPWFEPSLATEGILWFPDLLVPDPTGVLPFIVSGLMFTNVYITKNMSGNAENPTRFQKTLRRTLLTVALFIGPMCQEIPAALLLYWASSTSSVMAWNAWLDWRFPVVKGFGACKRPLLMMPPKMQKTRG